MNGFLNTILTDCGFSEIMPAFRVVMLEKKSVYIEGLTGFVAFSDTEVCVRVPNGLLTIQGIALKIRELSLRELVVEGVITSINM